MMDAMSVFTLAVFMNSARSALHVGHGFWIFASRIVRPPARSRVSPMPSNLDSRQPLQKVWPHGVLSGALSTFAQSLQPNSLSSFCCSLSSLRAFLGCATETQRP
jgi:hypothetical protein